MATEILPGPPPVHSVQQQLLKRDPKKPSLSLSYLPTSDPGTTYAGLAFATPPALQELTPSASQGPRPKRARVDKGRPQRNSARQLTSLSTPAEPIDVDTAAPSSPLTVTLPSDVDFAAHSDHMSSLSRSNSVLPQEDPPPPPTNGRSRPTRDKGKARAKELPSVVKVKEEPRAISLLSPEPHQQGALMNEDHCSACRSVGALVYCDGCPRAFHLLCLDPPMDTSDLPDSDTRWYCPNCCLKKNPPRRPPTSFLSPLLYTAQTSAPSEFQLPEDIRTFFKDVATGPQGGYLDISETKPPRLNRLGQLDDRDVNRLKDRNGAPVLCFRCGLSSLPASVSAPSPSTSYVRGSPQGTVNGECWNGIVSCDYCPLHWHMDCLDPPLVSVPAAGRKWMCPNHGSQVMPPKRRIPKANAQPIEITKPGQFNNGNIEVVPADPPVVNRKKVAVDEVLINGRKYRVPERIIILDFWNKVNGVPPPEEEVESGISSPLTSLSSLEDGDIPTITLPARRPTVSEHMQAAEMLFGLSTAKNPEPLAVVDQPMETDNRARRRSRHKPAGSSASSISLPLAKSAEGNLPSRTRNPSKNGCELAEPPRRGRVKVEETDGDSALLNGKLSDAVSAPPSRAAKRPRQPQRTNSTRRTRKRKITEAESAVEAPKAVKTVEAPGSASVDIQRSPLKISIRLPTSMRTSGPDGKLP